MNLPSNSHCTADVLFKLPALDQLFCPNEQDEGAVGRAEHTVDLVDADVAVSTSLASATGCWRRMRHSAARVLRRLTGVYNTNELFTFLSQTEKAHLCLKDQRSETPCISLRQCADKKATLRTSRAA